MTELTAKISSNVGDCHLSEAVFIYRLAVSRGTLKGLSTHGVDKIDAGEIDVLFQVFLDDLQTVDRLRSDIFVT